MPDMVLIHGMWCHRANWDRMRGLFEARGYTCHVAELPCHAIDGPQPHPDLALQSLRDYQTHLRDYIKSLPLDAPPILVGHSMGGLLALQLAAQIETSALAVITPAMPWGVWVLEPSPIWSMWEPFTTWRYWRKPCKPSFEKACWSVFNNLPPEDQRTYYDRMGYEAGRATFEICWWQFEWSKASMVEYDKVHVPVFIATALKDRLTHPRLVHRTIKHCRRGGLRVTARDYPDNAHWIIDEPGPGTEQLADDIVDWLKAERVG